MAAPSFDLTGKRTPNDQVLVSFFCELFQGFTKLKHLLLKYDHPLDVILTALGAHLKHMLSITIDDRNKNSCSFPDDVFSCSSLSRLTPKSSLTTSIVKAIWILCLIILFSNRNS